MQITVESTGGLERKMTVVLDGAPIEREFERQLREKARSARLKGFRPGKAPLKEVRRRFGQSLLMDVAVASMKSSFRDAVQQEELQLANAPNFEIDAPLPKPNFTFSATFEVLPEIELGDLSRVRIERPQATVTDADVDAMIETLRAARRQWRPVQRPAQAGDRVTFDLLPSGGEAFDGAGLSLIVDQPFAMPGVAEAVAGTAVGETRRVASKFPEFAADAALRGQEAEFDLTVKEVAQGSLPPLDDAFFAALGVAEGGEERFRQEVRDDLEARLAAAIRAEVRRQALEQIVELHEFDAPRSLIEREIATMGQSLSQQLGARIAAPGDAPELDAALRREAERRVRCGLLLSAIIQRQGLQPDADKVRERVEEIARGYAQPERVAQACYADAKLIGQVESAALEEQAIEHVLDAADVQNVARSCQEVIGGQPPRRGEGADAGAA